MGSPEENARAYRNQLREVVRHLEAANKVATKLPIGWHCDIPNLQSALGLLLGITQGMVHDINTFFTAHKMDAEEDNFVDSRPMLPGGKP